MSPRGLRTWIEIDKKALEYNLKQFLKLIPKRTRFMAVVKSNAYGHGLVLVARALASSQLPAFSFQQRLWFGVDSIVEGLRLRREGIKNPILVLGLTLPARMKEAAENKITLTISNFESLLALAKLKNRPEFHLKIDTGMHRQGFLPSETFKLIKLLKRFQLFPRGVFTHFSAAKDIAYPAYTLEQLRKFNASTRRLERAGHRHLLKHAAASGGTLLYPESHLDMVRVGIGLFGYCPSPEIETQLGPKIKLRPALTWKTIAGEIKEIPEGSYVSYDLTERVSRKTKIAILPIGYWHGYDRGLSGIGEVLIRGKRAKVLGRVTMDMSVTDVTGIPGIKVGDQAVLIGRQGKNSIGPDEVALKLATSPYEIHTRLNPLINRMVK